MPPDASSVSFATYFNPRSSCEERPKGLNSTTMALIFQSTLLMRGATFPKVIVLLVACIISIHAPHARSDKPIRVWLALNRLISIHAPHARSDCIPINRHPSVVISIHAPHARSDEAFVCRVVNL